MTRFDHFRKACEYFNPRITEGQVRICFYEFSEETINSVLTEYEKRVKECTQ